MFAPPTASAMLKIEPSAAGEERWDPRGMYAVLR